MTEHWTKIGYKPDTDNLNEVDEGLEPDIQVGRTVYDVAPKQAESRLNCKYDSVIIKGFRKNTDLDDVKNVMLQQGLPEEYLLEGLVRNSQSGAITVNGLMSV